MDKRTRNKQRKSKINGTKSIPTKRIAVLFVFIFLLIMLLVARIGWLQFVQGAELKELASRPK